MVYAPFQVFAIILYFTYSLPAQSQIIVQMRTLVK